MNRRIVFIIPSMRGGGAEKVTMLLCNELVRYRWNVSILLTKVEGPYLSRLDSSIKIESLPYERISKNIFAIKNYLSNNSIDIVYSSMIHVNIIVSIAYKLSNSKSRLILSEHNNITKLIERSSRIFRISIKISLKYIYPLSDHIVCVSRGVLESLLKVNQSLINLSVIYNPIEQFSRVARVSGQNKIFTIISVGRLNKQKNFHLLLDAFYYLLFYYNIEAQLIILGEGEELNSLTEHIKELSLENSVFLPGFQDPSIYLNSSDVFVLSSDREGFGNVIVEALSTGLPVVSTDCPSGPAEILSDGKFGTLVPAGDHQKLASAIYDVYCSNQQESDILNRMKRATDFSPNKVVLEYIKLFEKILEHKPSKSDWDAE